MDRSSLSLTEAMPESDVASHKEPTENHEEADEVWHETYPTVHDTRASDLEADPLPEADQRSVSIYWSLRSFSASTLSLFNQSSGRPSQDGATWDQALHVTNNSGFGPSGTPRSMGNKGVREGRERGGFLPRLRGIGRTGKEPYAVPKGMLKALGVVKEDEVPSITTSWQRKLLLGSVIRQETIVKREFAEVEDLANSIGVYSNEFSAVQDQLRDLDQSIFPPTDWDKERITEEQFEILKKLEESWSSIQSKLKPMDSSRKRDARLRREEEEERSRKEWDRVTGWKFPNDTRRFEPAHIEESIRKDYDTGVRRPRVRRRITYLAPEEPPSVLHPDLDSHSDEDFGSNFGDGRPESFP